MSKRNPRARFHRHGWDPKGSVGYYYKVGAASYGPFRTIKERDADKRRRRHTRRVNPSGTRYRGVITAIPGHLLRGGKKQVKSSWFNSKQEAAHWIYAMEQPGVETHHIERGAPRKGKRSNPGGPLDTHAAKELELFVENDADLYRQQYTPINKNLITKMARGVYKHDLAVKLFGYLMESGAKKYVREFGSPGDKWFEMFSPATRKAAAEVFAKHFEVVAKLGNYDNLLPKKYSDWRLKSNPNRLTDVLVKRGGKVFKAKAKYDAKLGRVRVFANPRVARAVGSREPAIYYYRGGVERGTGGRYQWREGYSENSPEGRPLYPWLTKKEAQRDAKRQGKKAVFKR